MADFEIQLYKNRAESNRLDKTEYITLVGRIRGVLRDESSLVEPVIIFESLDIPVFNYVYIPVLGRYYYVNDITSVRYKLWQLSLSVDVLMTYKDAILACEGFIDRNEFEYNSDVIDKKRVVRQGRNLEVDTVRNSLFINKTGSFVLSGVNVYSVID